MRAFILTTTLLLAATMLFGQNARKTNAILNTVDLINKDASYTTKALNTEDFLDNKTGESGQLIGYFKNGKLIKMHVRIAMFNCVRTDKYYLSNDSLIMFYRQERAFQYDAKTKSYEATHLMTALECRYYYDGNELLKTDSSGNAKCSDMPSAQQAAEMRATCKKYASLLKKK